MKLFELVVKFSIVKGDVALFFFIKPHSKFLVVEFKPHCLHPLNLEQCLVVALDFEPTSSNVSDED